LLEAFDTLFNRRDYAVAEGLRSPRYIQHSVHIAPGREGLLDLIRGAPAELRYEHGLILAEGDQVMVHGRFTGIGQPAPWIRSEHSAHRGRLARRALGCAPGRGGSAPRLLSIHQAQLHRSGGWKQPVCGFVQTFLGSVCI
jgi:hypothetical protein